MFKAFILCATAAPVDTNFAVDRIQSGNGKTKVVFDSSGRMYVTEKQGRVLLFNPDGLGGFQAPTILLDITDEVDSGLESGLLGFEVDPDHINNRFIYLFYTTPEEILWDGTGDQRLVRYTMNAAFNGIENNSETVLLSGLPRIVNFHKAGEIAIHPLEPYAILISLGDDDQVGGGGTLPQNLDSYVGKILRVDTSTGLGLPDNPHYNGVADSVRSRVWASGFRNPFRFVFHPTRADTLYVSENGDSTDRVAMVKKGGNGLWNGDDNGGFLTVDTPLFKVLDTTSPSLVGIEIVTSGPLAFNSQPTLYVGNWLSGISRYTLSDTTDPLGDEWDALTPIAGGSANHWDEAATAMDLNLAADGHLYFTQTNGNASLASWYPLRRYRFAGGTPPSASYSITPSSAQGEAPFLVNFTDTSTAGTNAILTWDWDFGDGNTSNVQNPSHTYTLPGVYIATLKVTDNVGLTDSFSLEISTTQNTMVILTIDIQDGRTLPAVPVTSAFTISLYQIDGATPLSFVGGVGIEGNQIVTQADGSYSGSLTLPLTDTGFVMVTEQTASPLYQSVIRGISVSLGDVNVVQETFYVSNSTVSGRVVSLQGDPVKVDIGVRSGGEPFAFAGARDYLNGSAFPATGTPHRIETDDLGYFSIPVPVSDAGATLELTYSEDTGRGTFAKGVRNLVTVSNSNVDASYNIANWRGGAADDLSAQPYTPSVPYTAIQNIFNANCTGCHRANTTNNGGLDLTTGNSYAELVDQMSLFVPGVKLVERGDPSRSYLFEKINSATPQQGTRMRPTDALPLSDQALIRDWITQLSPSYENYVWENFGVAPGSANTGISDDFNNNGIANGLEYANPRLESLSSSADGTQFSGEFRFNGNTSGLTLLIQRSDNLQGNSWHTVASRIRGQSNWNSAPEFTATETSPGVLSFTDPTLNFGQRFYRSAIKED